MQAERSHDHTPLGATDWVVQTLKRYLVREPVGTSVSIAFVAAAFTNSIAAFAIAGVLSWFSAKYLLSHDHGG
jgi:Na+/H+ antiporter NhaC